MSKKNSLTLSKQHGLNPTIPLCFYCDQPKNMVALTGFRGERLAKSLGHGDGQMPMQAWIPGDFVPCDACLGKGGIGVIAVGGDRSLEGVWLITKEAAERVFRPRDLERIYKNKYTAITKETAEKVGLLKPKEDEDGK